MGAPSAPSEGRRSLAAAAAAGAGAAAATTARRAAATWRRGRRGSDKPKPPPKKRDAKQPPKPRKPTPKQRAVEDARAADKVAAQLSTRRPQSSVVGPVPIGRHRGGEAKKQTRNNARYKAPGGRGASADAGVVTSGRATCERARSSSSK